MGLKTWFYRGGRPNRVARVLDRGTASLYARGLRPNYLVALEVAGRNSGRSVVLPLVMVVIANERYLVSMLGVEVNWVRNVRAAGGRAVLRHGIREEVCLEEIAPHLRAPVLREYLELAPNARVHIPVDRDAPPSEFEKLAGRFPVFRVV